MPAGSRSGCWACSVPAGWRLAWRRRRRRLKEMEGRRAEVLPLYDRLGADVRTAARRRPGRPAGAGRRGRALHRAGSQLSQADTHQEYEAARRTTLEGLQAARTARAALGLDPGPELPPIAQTQAPQLTEPQQVQVGGQTVQGYPDYTPGAPYYFGGGGGYAGGWYSSPFWETLLIGEVLIRRVRRRLGRRRATAPATTAAIDAGRDSAQSGSGGDWAAAATGAAAAAAAAAVAATGAAAVAVDSGGGSW